MVDRCIFNIQYPLIYKHKCIHSQCKRTSNYYSQHCSLHFMLASCFSSKLRFSLLPVTQTLIGAKGGGISAFAVAEWANP